MRCQTSRPRRTDTGRLLFARPLSKPQRHPAYVLSPKDFRRIATRYDRLAINFLAAVCIAAVVSSIGQSAKLQTLDDNDQSYVPPREMLRGLMNVAVHVQGP